MRMQTPSRQYSQFHLVRKLVFHMSRCRHRMPETAGVHCTSHAQRNDDSIGRGCQVNALQSGRPLVSDEMTAPWSTPRASHDFLAAESRHCVIMLPTCGFSRSRECFNIPGSSTYIPGWSRYVEALTRENRSTMCSAQHYVYTHHHTGRALRCFCVLTLRLHVMQHTVLLSKFCPSVKRQSGVS